MKTFATIIATALIAFTVTTITNQTNQAQALTQTDGFYLDNGDQPDYQSPYQAPWNLTQSAPPGTWRVFTASPTATNVTITVNGAVVYQGPGRTPTFSGNFQPLFVQGDGQATITTTLATPPQPTYLPPETTTTVAPTTTTVPTTTTIPEIITIAPTPPPTTTTTITPEITTTPETTTTVPLTTPPLADCNKETN